MGVCLIIRSSGGTDTSGATATAARVLSGYTCYVNDVKITGTMANQGTKTASLNAGGSYTIPAGYHSGSGKVTANALSGQTSATATAARILSGRTAWVNGSKLTGTMTNRGAISQKLAANGSYTVPAGWHNGSGKVTQSLTTQGAKNVTPTTSNQTACAASRWTTGNIVIVGASTLTAGNIKKGVKIFNVTGTFTGWIDNEITVFQNGTVYNHSTLGGGLTYSWGCWNWNATTKHDSSGGSVSVGTNIVLSVGSGTYSSGVLRHVGACVSSTNKIDPMFKSVKVYFNWVTSQENSDHAPRFLFGSHMNCLTNATYAASKDVTFWMWKDNRTGFTRSVNLWDDGGRDSQNDLYGWFRVGLECRLYYTNPNISSITITRITLSKTAV